LLAVDAPASPDAADLAFRPSSAIITAMSVFSVIIFLQPDCYIPVLAYNALLSLMKWSTLSDSKRGEKLDGAK
jgi:hypothetical protein